MSFEPLATECPVCKRAIQTGESGRCPVCEADLAALVRWRDHGERLRTLAQVAVEAGEWARAEALLRESLQFMPDNVEATILLAHALARLGEHAEMERVIAQAEALGVSGEEIEARLGALRRRRTRQSPRAGNRLWQIVAVCLVCLGLAASLGAYSLGRSSVPPPQPVTILATVVVTVIPESVETTVAGTLVAQMASAATATSTLTPSATATATGTPSPTATPSLTPEPPTPTPSVTERPATATASPTATSTVACPGLAATVESAWLLTDMARIGQIDFSASGCTVRLQGTVPTQFVLDAAVEAARSAGAMEIVTDGIEHSGGYIIQAGDTLWSLAGIAYGRPILWRSLYAANSDQIGDVATIPVGMLVLLPWEIAQ